MASKIRILKQIRCHQDELRKLEPGSPDAEMLRKEIAWLKRKFAQTVTDSSYARCS